MNAFGMHRAGFAARVIHDTGESEVEGKGGEGRGVAWAVTLDTRVFALLDAYRVDLLL